MCGGFPWNLMPSGVLYNIKKFIGFLEKSQYFIGVSSTLAFLLCISRVMHIRFAWFHMVVLSYFLEFIFSWLFQPAAMRFSGGRSNEKGLELSETGLPNKRFDCWKQSIFFYACIQKTSNKNSFSRHFTLWCTIKCSPCYLNIYQQI